MPEHVSELSDTTVCNGPEVLPEHVSELSVTTVCNGPEVPPEHVSYLPPEHVSDLFVTTGSRCITNVCCTMPVRLTLRIQSKPQWCVLNVHLGNQLKHTVDALVDLRWEQCSSAVIAIVHICKLL